MVGAARLVVGGGALVLIAMVTRGPAVLLGCLRRLTGGASLLMVGWLGLVTTAAAYLLFARGLQHLPAATVGTPSLAEPLTAATLSLLVLGERPAPGAALGAATLLAGLFLATLGLDITERTSPAAIDS